MAVSCCWRGHGRSPRGSRRVVQGGLNPGTSCQRCRGCCPQANWDVLPSPQDGKLYWCDARTDKIERIDLETGENREVVLSSNNMDMFSVSVFEEYIYWSDRCGAKGAGGCVEGGGSRWVLWRGGEGPCAGHSVTPSSFRTHANGSIKRGNKDNATESVSLRTGIGVQLKDIKVFNRARQKGRSERGGAAPHVGNGDGNKCIAVSPPRSEPVPPSGSAESQKRPSGCILPCASPNLPCPPARHQHLCPEQRGLPAAVPVPRRRAEDVRLRPRDAVRGRRELPRLRRVPALLGAHHPQEHPPLGREQPQRAHQALRGRGAHEERHRPGLRLPLRLQGQQPHLLQRHPLRQHPADQRRRHGAQDHRGE